MDIDKVLNNNRLVRALLGVTKPEFLALMPVFEQIVYEFRKSKKRVRAVGGGSKGNIKDARRKLFFLSSITPSISKI